MCAIAGIFDLYRHAEIDTELLRQMTDIQRHRGPDGRGVHHEPGLGLGHRGPQQRQPTQTKPRQLPHAVETRK